MYNSVLKRVLDIVVAVTILLITSPILLISMMLVSLYDLCAPLYIPNRVGKNFKTFRMFKLRSMNVGSDKNQIDTTAVGDTRITPVGSLLRKIKIDEVFQFINVLNGTMSIVGPRPNIEREVQLYTAEETHLLSASPGITDFSSIVFSDLAEIVRDAPDANIAYNQLVRPWKSKLGLFYIENISFKTDIALIGLTAVSIISRKLALKGIVKILKTLNAPEELINIASRDKKLVPTPPPGTNTIVTKRV